MLTSVFAVVRNGKIEVTDGTVLSEGAKLVVTVLPSEEEGEFWRHASEPSLAAIWDNPQDDVYAKLLET